MASRVVVYASSSPVQGQRPESQRVRSSTGAHVNVFPTRKLVQQGLLSGLAAAAMVLSSGPALAESMTFTFEKPEIKEKLKERDTAMDFQCKGWVVMGLLSSSTCKSLQRLINQNEVHISCNCWKLLSSDVPPASSVYKSRLLCLRLSETDNEWDKVANTDSF